jgi:carbonic anhydrase
MRFRNKLLVFGLSSLSLAIAVFFLTVTASAHPKNAEGAIQAYRLREAQATPDGVLEWLKAGNRRFAQGIANHGNYPQDARERIAVSGAGQRPLAAVLSCIDSRTSPELVFDVSVGDIFTARVGANVINDDIIGSLEIAAESGARVIIVLGHTDCGGVRAACSGLELGHMTQLLNRIKPAIASLGLRLDQDSHLAAQVGERIPSNRRYIAEVAHENSLQSLRQLLERSEILRGKVARGEILVISAMYDVESGLVSMD